MLLNCIVETSSYMLGIIYMYTNIYYISCMQMEMHYQMYYHLY